MSEKIYDDEEDKANAELANDEAQPYPEEEGPKMRNRDKALKWLADQSANPTQSWKGLCQAQQDKPGRAQPGPPAPRTLGLLSMIATRSSALTGQVLVAAHPCWGDHLLVPPTSKYGHAWVAAGDMTGWSVDYKRSGYIDLVEIRLKGGLRTTSTPRGIWAANGTRATAGSRASRKITGTKNSSARKLHAG